MKHGVGAAAPVADARLSTFVSPAMRVAGAAVIEEWNGVISSQSLAEEVYSAMIAERDPLPRAVPE